MDQSAIDELAQTFMRARRTGERLDALPAHLKPKNFADSCAVMDAVDKLVGEPIVGTKIAAKPGAEVVYAPLPAGRVFTSPARVPRALTPSQYMECEISFRLTRDLPARRDEYSEQEVFDALEACAAFELVDSRFRDLKSAMEQHALRILRRPHRQRRHGVRTLPQGLAEVRLHQDPRVDEAGRHRPSSKRPAAIRPAIRPSPPWCWPTCGAATTGLKAGTFIVTGSFTGFHPVELNQPVTGEFEGFGTMEATIVGLSAYGEARCAQSTFSFG